jgi:hypothetical protein
MIHLLELSFIVFSDIYSLSMPRKPREIERLLQAKFGFSPAVEHSSDHRWYELRLPGLPPILTMVSHNKKEVGRRLESKIARQLRVHRPYFEGMMDCTHACEDYYRQVREDPFPPFDVRF